MSIRSIQESHRLGRIGLSLVTLVGLGLGQGAQAQRATLLQPYEAPSSGGIPVAFFDADYTLRMMPSGAPYPLSAKDLKVLPGVPEKIAELTKRGYFIAIVSNQAHYLMEGGDPKIPLAMMKLTIEGAQRDGGKIHYMNYSTNWDEVKPKPFMADNLEQVLKAKYGPTAKIDKAASFMVGDAAYREVSDEYRVADLRPNGVAGTDFENFDRLFAKNIGVKFYEPDEFFRYRELGVTRIRTLDDFKKVEKGFAARNATGAKPASCSRLMALLAWAAHAL